MQYNQFSFSSIKISSASIFRAYIISFIIAVVVGLIVWMIASRRLFATRRSTPLFSPKIQPLISAKQALEYYTRVPDYVVFLDSSWSLDKTRVLKEEFNQKRLPFARFFDIDQVCDKSTGLPHMLPTKEIFDQEMTRLKVSESDYVIVYNSPGCISASRAWWTLKAFGHKRVSVLNGGLNAWVSVAPDLVHSPSNTDPVKADKTPYSSTFDQSLVVSFQDVIKNNKKRVVLDARPAGRFLGQVPEPRPGLRSGHIPGSKNVPFSDLFVDGDLTQFKAMDDLKKVLKEKIGDDTTDYITSCGSGVTAASLSLALHVACNKKLSQVPVYDGSWTEYGSKSDADEAFVEK